MPRIIPSIPVDFDRPRTLRFDRRAVFQSEVELSRVWGKPTTFYEAIYSLANVFGDTAMALSLNNLSVLLWQGFLHETPSLTLDEVQDALPFDDPAALFPLAGKVLEAWQAMSVPPADTTPTEVSDADPLAPSTGAPSGPTSASI